MDTQSVWPSVEKPGSRGGAGAKAAGGDPAPTDFADGIPMLCAAVCNLAPPVYKIATTCARSCLLHWALLLASPIFIQGPHLCCLQGPQKGGSKNHMCTCSKGHGSTVCEKLVYS